MEHLLVRTKKLHLLTLRVQLAHIMILVTGPTGCVGKAVVDRLTSSGHIVKCLWHWGREHRVPARVHIAGGDVRNLDSLYSAMAEDSVDTVIHLASIRREDADNKFDDVNVQGTRNVISAAKRANINRIIMVGALGAEARSAFPFLRSIGKAEEVVRASGLNFTILKSAVVYGEGDWLTTWMQGLINDVPLFVAVPHSGDTKLQPIWVGDVAACVERSLQTRSTYRQVVPVGGPQALSLAEIAQLTMRATGKMRRLMRVPTRFTRHFVNLVSRCRGALSETEVEALSYNRTTEIGSVHRIYGFAPAKMQGKLLHLSPHFQPAPPAVKFV
jgi:NADH dehydrogenase